MTKVEVGRARVFRHIRVDGRGEFAHPSCFGASRTRRYSSLSVTGATVVLMSMLSFSVAASLSAQDRADASTAIEPLGTSAGIENMFKLGKRIYSGGEPTAEASFEKLKEMGVVAIVSVDAARPNVELAKKYGLRYVHVPMGYDGISTNAQGSLIRVMREIDGPVFVHCHHGRHRGPAAAAIACLASSDFTVEQAKQFLEKAGTGKQYAGLWRDVAKFRQPDAKAKLPELRSVVEERSLASSMAAVDRYFEKIVEAEKQRDASATRTTSVFAENLPLLREELLESARHDVSDRPAEVKTGLLETAQLVNQLEDASKQNRRESITRVLGQLQRSCTDCHKKFRDQ
ncbi:MAG: hypothetical protein RIS70_2619 [Planctomycetota bacterium]